jgi:phosphoribosylaminoimidazolecarboxamide formyltransferase/IMP cyclohydrolase
LALRSRLAGAAFARTAEYDCAIADYLARQQAQTAFPSVMRLTLNRRVELRYGENPHQRAALYELAGCHSAGIVTARQLHGKELSFNNLLDLDSALSIGRSLTEPAVAVIKHNNPCGAAVATTLREAAELALRGDPLSAFGSVLGLNRSVDTATASFLATPGLFIEAIVAPEFDSEAIEILTTKPKWRENVRLMQVGRTEAPDRRQLRFLAGGVLAQDSDEDPDPRSNWRTVTDAKVSEKQMHELEFAWAIVRHVKSNAIVLSHGRALCGVGAGQTSRVDAVEIAIRKAGTRAAGAVLASDAFFPFPDSIERAAKAGIAAVIQPGGSVKDAAVIGACNQFRLPMIFTGRRHFKH